MGYKPWLNLTNEKEIFSCRFLARCSLLLEWDMDSQDNVTEWDIRAWYSQPGIPVEQHYQVTIRAHYHKSVHILI